MVFLNEAAEEANPGSSPLRPVSASPPSLPLAEAHHRIANSLQVIVSLVRLQAADLAKRKHDMSPREVQHILDDVAGRIGTVALLHRLLSKAPQQGVVDLGGYLRNVCQNLAAALSFGGQVDMSGLAIGTCHISADQAVPLAVLVSELATNAIKYAHPSGVPGRIAVSCRRAADGTLVLEIGDDGVGLPEGFDPAVSGGLGFRVVRALAQKLDGTLTFESTPLGLTVRLEMPGMRQ